jgi:hypothetical protein
LLEFSLRPAVLLLLLPHLPCGFLVFIDLVSKPPLLTLHILQDLLQHLRLGLRYCFILGQTGDALLQLVLL